MFVEACFNCEERFRYKNVIINSEEEVRALDEVKNYYKRYYKRYLNVMKGLEERAVWWIINREVKPRVKEQCKSLCLSTGEVCTELREIYNYCKYHYVQHNIVCTKYHAQYKVNLVGVEEYTKSFIEFCLRKEFDFIFGFGGLYQSEMGHRDRYATLLCSMFKAPYASEHVGVIDAEFTRDAQLMYNVWLRKQQCKYYINRIMNPDG